MSKKRVLVVDDDPPVRRVLTMSLEMAGFEVKVATNGEEALQCIADSHPDAMITDINMPKMDGRELCKQIYQKYPNRSFRIVVMTANVGRDEKEWVADIPDIKFLEKPVSPRDINSMLADYFNSAE